MAPPYSDSSSRWKALQHRDPAANSAFLYGVRTTHIFCRPTCPGRLARRSNVVFFNSAKHASQAGYRPCKRCEPCKEGWDRDIHSRTIAERARDLIAASVNARVEWTVEGVARELGISSGHLHRLFRKFLGATPRGFAVEVAAVAAGSAAAQVMEGFPPLSVDADVLSQERWLEPALDELDATFSLGEELRQYDTSQESVGLESFLLWDLQPPWLDDIELSAFFLPDP